MEASISGHPAGLIRASSLLKGISPFLSFTLLFMLFFFFFSSRSFHFGSFLQYLSSLPLKILHLFLCDTTAHWSLYQCNSIECNLLAGNMRKKQYGKLNPQILSCISRSWSYFPLLDCWFVSNNYDCSVCVCVCVCVCACVRACVRVSVCACVCACVDCEWSLSLCRSLWGSCRQGSVTPADPLCDGTAGMSAKSFTCKAHKYCLYTISMVNERYIFCQYNTTYLHT